MVSEPHADKSHKDSPIRYAHIAGVIAFASLVYVVWFIAEIVSLGTRNGWQFNTNGLYLTSVHAAVVAVTGAVALILSCRARAEAGETGGEAKPPNRCVQFLQIILPITCGVVSAGYFWFYIPLQSNFFVWLLRWVPWGIFALLGLCPLCNRGCMLGQRRDDTGSLDPGAMEEGGIPVTVD
mmetsp:Transcript_19961/g.40429  ORF Transcript_19961/g.40429 Transcript_19961/m.40429 type:complete len:181 (-) Transcript_19961:313-855(-)|eukprot:CAMPEP_0183306512 /NCGR_PEP_ID=MMETSP0160_2-20130417/12132_1 /TAXON_ID=2839 ORGANISM="Odontella Sinensis, Strain Grunow 1884" /NCGR_SAMPLE_ID=MMETSP0160_2 /ASSEMBLY_ACC=CAM_ASM_000250 /LENGTH=180 /DNA_ID=CAMNT_0025469907 /DNA_START=202 /DNA_END=744 /DNA_ORIENTATION=-